MNDVIFISTIVMLFSCYISSHARVERLEDDLYNFTDALVHVASFFCEQGDSESNSPKFQAMTSLPPLSVVCLSVLIHHLKQFGLEQALRADG
jgi:hypothetical protein